MAGPHRQPDLRLRVAGWLRRLATAVAPRHSDTPDPARPGPASAAVPGSAVPGSAAVPGGGPAERTPGGPPEHWLALVRERAPQLLEPDAGPPAVADPGPSNGRFARLAGRVLRVDRRSAAGSHRAAPEPGWPEGAEPGHRAEPADPGWPAESVTRPAAPAPAPGVTAERPVPVRHRLGRLLRWPVEALRRLLAPMFGPEPVRTSAARRTARFGDEPAPPAPRDGDQRVTQHGAVPDQVEPNAEPVWPDLPASAEANPANPAWPDAGLRHLQVGPHGGSRFDPAAGGGAGARNGSAIPTVLPVATVAARRTAVVEPSWPAELGVTPDQSGRHRGGLLGGSERTTRPGERTTHPTKRTTRPGERTTRRDVDVVGPWAELPDDSGLWVAAAPAYGDDRVRRLEREQRGW